MKPMQLSVSLVTLIAVPYCNALFHNFGQSSSGGISSRSSSSTSRHLYHEQQQQQQHEYQDQPVELPSEDQSSFGAVGLPLIGTGSDIWTSGVGQQDMYRDSEHQMHYPHTLHSEYELPPFPTTPSGTYEYGHYHSFEDPMHNLALDSPAFELPPDTPPSYHENPIWDGQVPSAFSYPHSLPPYRHRGSGDNSGQASFGSSPGGVSEEDMQDMILESSMPHLYHSKTVEGHREDASSSARATRRERRGKDLARDDAPARQPQTPSVRKPRNRNIVIERTTPSATTETVAMNEKENGQEPHSFLRWLKQQWSDRGMNFGMHAQMLARQVAEIKIKYPKFAVYIGRRSSDWVKEAKKGENEGDEWYLYDYEEWSTTYRKRINNLKAQWEKKHGGAALNGPVLEEMLLRELGDTQPSHYAQLADQDKEADELDRARNVWEEFEQKRLQRRIQQDGEELSMQMIAQESCFFNSSHVSGHAKTIMYINKYLRNMKGWRPGDLASLQVLQEQFRARFAPLNTRGQQRMRKVSK